MTDVPTSATTGIMGKRTPEISVIVPVYKVEKYLHECVDSILAQTFRDFELLLIDDGSPDKCGEICDEYAKKDPRVRVFHKKNSGVSSSRNRGLNEAKGKWISFVDSDDYIDEEFLEILHKIATQTKVDLVFCTFKTIPEKNTNSTPDKQISGEKEATKALQELITGCGCEGFPWNKLYRGDIIRKYNLKFNETISIFEDILFVIRFLKTASTTYEVNRRLYNYRIRENGAVSSFSIKACRNRILSINLIENELKSYEWSRPFIDKRKSIIKFAIVRRFAIPRKELLGLWREASPTGLSLSKRILLKAFYLPFPFWVLFFALPVKMLNKLEGIPKSI